MKQWENSKPQKTCIVEFSFLKVFEINHSSGNLIIRHSQIKIRIETSSQ